MPEKTKNCGDMTMSQLGALGGKKTSEKHGPDFYKKIGRQGGLSVKRMIERGHAAEKKDQDER